MLVADQFEIYGDGVYGVKVLGVFGAIGRVMLSGLRSRHTELLLYAR